MRESFWNKRIPTLIGLVLLMVGVAFTSYLTRSGIIFQTQASPGNTPTNIRITNITESSFTVSYTTSDTVAGIIAYGTDQSTTQTATDDRSPRLDNLGTYQTHHITVKNLTASTKYYFNITSGSDTFLNNGILFEVTTAPSISEVLPNKKIQVTGKVINSDGQTLKEGLVYVTANNGQTLSTILKSDGTYGLSAQTIRTTNLNTYLKLTDSSVLKLLIINASAQSNATILTKDSNAIPVITLSQDYDFTAGIQPIATSSAQLTGFPSFTGSIATSSAPKIVTPKEDQSFTDQRPTFRGTAQPTSNVTIIVESEEKIEETVTTDSRGNWVFRPKTPLAPGDHTITITTRDQFGILKTISQNFTVHASGTTVSQTATPSATPTTIVTPTAIPTVLTPTPTTTIAVTPTIVSTTPLPTDPVGASKGGVVLEPGTPSTLIGAGAIITTITGIILFFFSQGSSLL